MKQSYPLTVIKDITELATKQEEFSLYVIPTISKSTVPVGQNSWETTYQDWAVNPTTGVAWTWANINTMTVGFKCNGSSTKCSQYETQTYVGIIYSDPKTIIQGCTIQGCTIS